MLALLAAVALSAPNRPAAPRWLNAAPKRTVVAVGLAMLFVASSLYSTATFLDQLAGQPSTALSPGTPPQAGLAGAHAASDAPLLDQEVDPVVLQRVAAPENLASHMFALLRDGAGVRHGDNTIAHAGQLRPAGQRARDLGPHRSAGPTPQCGYFAQPDKPARLILDGPLLPADWTVELNYLANSDGSMTLSLTQGPDVKVPVHPGLNRVFARLPGAGDAITVRANTTALALCIASGPVGFLAPA